MSRISDLVAELCPDGVEHRTLGELGVFTRGNGLQKKDLTDVGVGAIHYGQIFTVYGISTSTTTSYVDPAIAGKLRKAKPGDLVIATTSENDEDVCKAVAWIGDAEIAISGDAYVYSHELDPIYLAHWFQTEAFQSQKQRFITGTKVKRVSGADLARIRIPDPPVEIQAEIGRILDKFSGLEAKLEAELEAELKARRRQYKHYRAALLSGVDAEFEWAQLGDVATNLDSRRRPVTKNVREPGPYPYYGASGVVDYVNDYIFDGDYLLVSEDGANLLARSSPIAFTASGKTWINNHAHVLQFNDYPSRRFIEFYLNSIDLTPYISGAAQPKLNKANLNRIPVPIPSGPERAHIVEVLDSFDALVNELSAGLPAEISARRKQYEYYRDQLLTFEEKRA